MSHLLEETGSTNYMARLAAGYVLGTPKYASSEPHHVCRDGAWSYEEMFHAATDETLTAIIDGTGTGRIECCLVWLESTEQTFLRVQRNGQAEDVLVPDECVEWFAHDFVDGDEYVCLRGVLSR